MEEYDVGILTFWNVPNYGTYAQAYALQKILENVIADHDIRQIAYLNEYHYNFYYNKQAIYKIWTRSYWTEKIHSMRKREEKELREKEFLKDYDFIPHTKLMDKNSLGKTQFKYVVLGSDIIWDYSIGVFQNDPYLFGIGLKSEKTVSYAASFGTVKMGMEVPEYVAEGLKKMAYITVRDENSADIVENIVGKRPEVVLDPAWVWDFYHDPNVSVPEIEDYIVVYGQDFDDKFIKELIIYAREQGLKLVALDCNEDNYDWCDYLVKQKDLSPFKWIGYFKGAKYVATSTFHGLTFALIFKKKIAFAKTDFILAKIDNFLKELGIYEILVDNLSVEKMFDYEWDYGEIERIIEKKRKYATYIIRKMFLE